MKPPKRLQPLSEHAHVVPLSKCRHSSKRFHSHHKNKSTLSPEAQTIALNPDPPRCLVGFNSYNAICRSHRRRKKQSILESSSTMNSRKWVFSSRDSSSYRDKVVIVSYNILGVENASNHEDLYCNVSPKYLKWDRRKTLVCKEIKQYNASILCLQEVDRFTELKDLFQKDGFKGVYKARTGEAFDGCAIFWKEELFSLLHHESIEYQDYGLRNNVAQLCVLKMNEHMPKLDADTQSIIQPFQNRTFVIGNIHVLFNPKRGDIKLGQVRLLIEKASKLSREWGCIPVILCGDLNSIPQSPIYQFLASSKLDIRLYDRCKISGQIEANSKCKSFRPSNVKISSLPVSHRWSEEELRLATGSEVTTHLKHHLKLCSAYLGASGSCRTRDNYGEPLATSYHSKFMGTVDYIWHTEEFVPVKVLETLPIDILKRTGGLPSKKWGSDHLALVCELAFVDKSDEPLRQQ
ncbi:carbon catabolite repressor protein 4 homolog 5-like [Cannabis sativa]|nr:carbon catabolite repressor protein 4 homolog 5-like [Cannabis sativa]XP_030493649.1 carbon catabolite repressor protein 4 homolog 5-like [Cannabis sativa]